jgi:hypothetical protein
VLSEELCKICRVIHTKLDDGGAATRYVGEYYIISVAEKVLQCIGKLVCEELTNIGSIVALHAIEEFVCDGILFSVLITKDLEMTFYKMSLKILANAGASVKRLGAQRAVRGLDGVVAGFAIGANWRPGIIETLAASYAGRDTEKKE